MKYQQTDLDYIFIRTKLRNGKWGNSSLNDITDEQFVEWAERRFEIEIKDDENAKDTPWNPQQKINFLNDMNKRMDGKPCVAMIKREAKTKK